MYCSYLDLTMISRCRPHHIPQNVRRHTALTTFYYGSSPIFCPQPVSSATSRSKESQKKWKKSNSLCYSIKLRSFALAQAHGFRRVGEAKRYRATMRMSPQIVTLFDKAVQDKVATPPSSMKGHHHHQVANRKENPGTAHSESLEQKNAI